LRFSQQFSAEFTFQQNLMPVPAGGNSQDQADERVQHATVQLLLHVLQEQP
jgi:hypothetical protein